MSTKRVSRHYDRVARMQKPREKRRATLELLHANNQIVREVIQRHCPLDATILELGCGKGGAIWKWSAMKFHAYHGVDISSSSIDSFKQRIRNKGLNVTLYVDDMCRSDHAIWQTIPKLSIVSTQFCFHYCWETEARWKRCVDLVANGLVEGGKWIGTIVDASVLRTKLPYHSSICSIQQSTTRTDEYVFSLQDAVHKCTEWMVDWEALVIYAKSKHLHVLEKQPFSYIRRLSAEERDVHTLYVSFVFQKQLYVNRVNAT